MSIKLLHEPQQLCPLIQEIGGYCYCRPNVNSKPRPKGIYEENKIVLDFADYLNFAGRGIPINLTVDFGLVPVESAAFREIHLVDSSSQIPLRTLTVRPWKSKTIDRAFRIIQPFPDGQDKPEESCGDGKNVVAKKLSDTIKFRLVFEPELPTMNYGDAFLIYADDKPIRLECRGLSEGPSVCFSENVINFGGQYYQAQSRQWFKMLNSSGCEAQFQFDNDNARSTFKICPISGIIPPFMTLTVEVLFQAQKAQTYYKRVVCLLHHQQPQYVDLIGICIARPFFAASPIDFCISTAETRFLPFPTYSNDDYFDSHHFWGINFSKAVVDFGFQDVHDKSAQLPEPITLHVTSILPYDVVLEWFQDPLEIFVVMPQICTLPAFHSIVFEVYFQPNFPDTFYSGLLECFVYPLGHLWPSPYGAPWEVIATHNLLELNKRFALESVVSPVIPVTVPETAALALEKEKGSSSDEGSGQRKVSAMEELLKPEEEVRISVTDLTQKSKGKGGKKKGIKAKMARSSPAILPSSSAASAEKEADQPEVMVTSASVPSLPFSKKSLKPDLLPDIDLEPRQSISVEMQTLPFQVTVQHSVGGVKRPIRLEPIQARTNSEAAFTEDSFQKLSSGGGDGFEPLVYDMDDHNSQKLSLSSPEQRLENSSSKSLGFDANRNEQKSQEDFPTPPRRKFSSFKSAGEPLRLNSQPEDEIIVLAAPPGHDQEGSPGLSSPSSTMPKELAIPLCLTLRVLGHTFGNHTLIPHYKVPKKITMNPTWPHHRICRSFILRNKSDLPLYFDCKMVDGEGIYRVKPPAGVIPGNFHQIILVSMMPQMRDSCLYVHNCQVEFNLTDKNLICFRGIAEFATLDVIICYSSNINENEIVCPETIPGCGSDTFMEFINTSRFHYKYALSPMEHHDDDVGVFTPTPSEGIMAPYETIRIKWRFVPQTDEPYYIKWKSRFHVLTARTEFSTGTGNSTHYELPITLAGVGRTCVFQAKPDNLEFEMVEIFNEKEMFFTITNLSNAVVTANLRIMHEEWLQYNHTIYQARRIRINPTTVTLSGSESARVSVIVRPDRTNFQKYYIEYVVELTDVEDEQQSNVYKKLCDISFIGDHAIFKVTDVMMISRHPIWDAGQCWSMFSLDNLNEYLMPNKNSAREGIVPSIPSVYFRFPPAPIGADPAIVTILLSNKELLRGFWEMHILPPKEWAKRAFLHKKDKESEGVYDGNVSDNKPMLNLIWTKKLVGESMKLYKGRAGKNVNNDAAAAAATGVIPQGSISHTQTKGHHSHGHHNIYPHHHTPAGTEALKDIEFFKISPMRGTLKPRESQQISFRYSYKTVGHHHMSVLVRIHPAIFIWIELLGRTLGENEPYVQLIHKDFMQFHPVCLSDMDPPIQMFWLFNGGNAPSQFTVDPEPFEQVKNDNFGHEIFECLSLQGVVPPRAWAPILIRFSPLELLEYSIALNVKSENTLKSATLKGQAVLTPATNLRAETHGDISRKLRLIDPLVPVTISPTHVTFTHFVPTGQKSTSIVFLTNLSAKNKISFTWPDIAIEGGGSITFVPDAGVIRAKQQATIMVVVRGGKVATIFSRMIRCSMIDESSLARYDLLTKVWNSHKDVLVKTMTESEAVALLNKKFDGKPVKPSTFSRVLSVKVYIGSVFGLLDSVLPKELTRMPFSDTVCQPLRKNRLELLPFARQLCRGILSSMIWDLINSPSFSSYVKRMSKRAAPFYYEYKSSEMQNKLGKKGKMKKLKEPLVQFPRQASQDVLEQVIFNMIQEVAEDFYPGKTNHVIKPVQPQELIDVKKYRRDLL